MKRFDLGRFLDLAFGMLAVTLMGCLVAAAIKLTLIFILE